MMFINEVLFQRKHIIHLVQSESEKCTWDAMEIWKKNMGKEKYLLEQISEA